MSSKSCGRQSHEDYSPGHDRAIVEELNGGGCCPSTGDIDANTARIMDDILATLRVGPLASKLSDLPQDTNVLAKSGIEDTFHRAAMGMQLIARLPTAAQPLPCCSYAG